MESRRFTDAFRSLRAFLKQVRHYRSVGAWGERRALWFYTLRGYILLDRNWRCRFGELDLLFHYRDHLVVVEVKTRKLRHSAAYPIRAAISREKERRVRRLTHRYVQDHIGVLRHRRIRSIQYEFLGVEYRSWKGIRFGRCSREGLGQVPIRYQ